MQRGRGVKYPNLGNASTRNDFKRLIVQRSATNIGILSYYRRELTEEHWVSNHFMTLLYQYHWWTMYKDIEMKPRQFITNIKLRKMNNSSESKYYGD